MQHVPIICGNGKSISAAVYEPATTAPHGVVVIAYGSDGLTDNLHGPWKTMVSGYAEQLAADGFTALIPDYFAYTASSPAPAPFTSPGPTWPDDIFRHRDDWQRAISDAVDHATVLAAVDPKRVGLLGFSLGGHLCLRLRAKAQVLVEFFAPEFPELGGIGPAGTLSHAQIHHGDNDVVVPLKNATLIAKILRAEGTATKECTYPGAGHGFATENQADQDARDLSRQETLAFFQANL